MPDSKPKKKTGRPKKVIDYELVDSLCEIQCTGEEIASVLNVDYDTLNRHMKNDFGKSFTEYFELKRKSGRASLRRKQWQMADNNPTMAIWLGKQYLNQTDKSVVENHNLNTEMPTIVVDDSVQDE